jgi:hypothetical protein
MHMEQAFRAGYNQGLLVRERQIGEARAALYRIGVEVDVVMSNSVISENGRQLG